jgi:hypothetical protein
MRWVVSLADVDAPCAEVSGIFRVVVAARHRQAAEDEQLREGTHPGAGYADEVNWS